MIPKIINYCWFGMGEKPELAYKCIASWKKFCPDYEIKEWNETNFDINSNQYVKEAYENKKYAFVTDYVRLYVMYNYGGIYMDTDVEVIKGLDDFIKYSAFSGFESSLQVPTGIMACEKGFELFKVLLDDYNDRHFVDEKNNFDLTTNVERITGILEKYGLQKNDCFQIVEGFALFPHDYFCPKDYNSGKILSTNNTYAIHHFSGSWVPETRLKELNTYRKITKLFGVSNGERILLAQRIMREQGIVCLIKKINKKLFH